MSRTQIRPVWHLRQELFKVNCNNFTPKQLSSGELLLRERGRYTEAPSMWKNESIIQPAQLHLPPVWLDEDSSEAGSGRGQQRG